MFQTQVRIYLCYAVDFLLPVPSTVSGRWLICRCTLLQFVERSFAKSVLADKFFQRHARFGLFQDIYDLAF
jgi:hypothetical protein